MIQHPLILFYFTSFSCCCWVVVFYLSGSWSHGNKSRQATALSLWDLMAYPQRKGGRITFSFHLILCAKQPDGAALINHGDKSSLFCCIVNYPKWGPGWEVDRLGSPRSADRRSRLGCLFQWYTNTLITATALAAINNAGRSFLKLHQLILEFPMWINMHRWRSADPTSLTSVYLSPLNWNPPFWGRTEPGLCWRCEPRPRGIWKHDAVFV